jgi:LPXTG-motif cell wall-anchored protein
MSTPKVIGPAAAAGAAVATLPVTGSPVATIVLAGTMLVVSGLLLVRASRFRHSIEA